MELSQTARSCLAPARSDVFNCNFFFIIYHILNSERQTEDGIDDILSLNALRNIDAWF